MFSLVSKFVTTWCLHTLDVCSNWNMYQLDINNVSLYGELEEDIYMCPPPGYFTKSDTRVCKLRKSLYVPKQGPREYNEK